MILLIIHESMDAILFSESLKKVILMFVYPSYQIICHSNIESAVLPACHNIDIVTVHG